MTSRHRNRTRAKPKGLPETNGAVEPKPTQPKSPLGEVTSFIRRYVVMTDDQLLVVGLWVLHTHLIDIAEQTPYLAVTSPEKQCGKSRLLEVLDPLVRDGWQQILPSEAVVYRTVNARMPTLLLDEVDTIFNPRTADKYEGLRALLNSGHRRSAKVPRCVGATQNIVEFSTFCPKVLAGIGTLPDTVADRSIPIRLARKTRDEHVERFTQRVVKPVATALHDQIRAWAAANRKVLAKTIPDMPDEISDRMQEGCEQLVAIADRLGAGVEARKALLGLLTGERLDDVDTWRLRLLRDIKAIFDEHPNARAAHTANLLGRLHSMEEAGWDGYYGGLDARGLASLLHHYGIASTTVNVRGERAKGYRRRDFEDAWKRYVT
jgi:hypothetical protein